MRPDLSPTVSALIERMCSIRIEDRPASASEALASLTSDTTLTGTTLTETLRDENVSLTRIGPWVLGAQVYASSNWAAYAVTHIHTGIPARLTQIQPGGPISHASDLIIASAKRASRFDSPKILEVFDWGINDGRAYVVTAPQGRTLQALVESGGSLDELEALKCAHDLAEGLAYLHGKGFVYQVVDPGSAIVTQNARSAQLSWPVYCAPAGTPTVDQTGLSQRVYVMNYAAPEAITNLSETIDPAADLYSLGVVIYYLLAGKLPHTGITAEELLNQKLQGAGDIRAHANLVTAPTARLVNELLQPDPADRPASAEDVSRELANIINKLQNTPKDSLIATASVDPKRS
jgi:serine/threonine protein kinase